MSDDDFKALLYVVRSIRRTYEHSYGSFRHSIEMNKADEVFQELFTRYCGEDGRIYPQDEDALIARLNLKP